MRSLTRFFQYTFLLLVIISCSAPETTRNVEPIEFSEYISGYSSGQISSKGEIAVTLAKAVEPDNQQVQGLFKINPAVTGKTRWASNTTVVFKPDNKLKNGQQYDVSFMLGKLAEVEETKSVFGFTVTTIPQNLEVEFSGIESDPQNRNQQRLSGTIYTADVAEIDQIKQVLSAEQPNQGLEINWRQDGRQKTHHFQISGIQRKEKPSELTVSWDGAPIGAPAKNSRKFNIVPSGAFELMEVLVFRNENPRVELTFSDPLDLNQNLDGLIRIDNANGLNFIINENRIIINPRRRSDGMQTLYVNAGLQNAEGKKLAENITRQVRFFQPKPQVELLGNGVIIPRSKNLLFPFKAVSLGAVDVRVSRIFQNNIGQFFQDNELNGSSRWSLQRVGRPVYSDVIPLSELGSIDPGRWNNYALDLSNLIEPEPGAIYQVEISFRPHQAAYPCSENSEISNVISGDRNWKLNPEEEQSYWDNFDSYYYPAGYDWEERDNPCHVSYYNNSIRQTKNVLASDLGLIAKKDDENNLIIYVTDLLTAQPESGVEVVAYDYQQQPMVAGNSDINGKITFETPRTPFYLVASMAGQKAYLKMNDGNALSVSDFDVSGTINQKGVKGFLYGERGVWRPGDSLFVTFILEDKNDALPDNHPVTFELVNPTGQTVDRQTLNSGSYGFYIYKGKTEPQARTGNWRLEAKIGGLTFSENLKIEAVKPNRLKIEVDFEDEPITAPAREMNATLTSQWLHGATAKNLKADVEMSMRTSAPYFSDYRGFSFNDASVSFSSEAEPIFEGTLNAQGKAEFSHQFPVIKEGPARIMINLRTRVFEPSGNFSIGQSGTYYYPFKTILGIKSPQADDNNYWNWLDRDEPQKFEVVSVNFEGNPIPNKELKTEVYHIRWRWWWERGRENLSSYFERENVQRISTGTVKTDETGKGQFIVELPENSKGGRYLIRVKDANGGHSASSIVYFSWYGERSESVSPARLNFTSDKESYNVGDNITLTIPSSESSSILVSLESGSKVITSTWIHGKQNETEYTFTAEENMAPNIYAHVMHIQPHGQQNNDLPIRMYGVIPISVENPATKLEPVIKMPEEIRPETTVDLEISENDGKAMTYTIAMVDEGLLDLTNFATPEPHIHFYAREALGIKTWDVFDDVSTAYGENLSRILSIGGDASEAEVNPLNEANRFEPMVRFQGPFNLKSGTVNQHKISIPNYVGSVRTMVIAGRDGAYGQTQETTPIRKPVMVLATLPRVLGPGEMVNLPVSVFAMKDNIKNVQLRVEANDLFEIGGDAATTVHFDEPGDKIEDFKLKTASRTGVGKVRVQAVSGEETAYHEIEIAVRNPNTPFVDVRSETIEEGGSRTVNFEPQGMIGTNSATLEISRIPPVDFGKRLSFLIRYPHGCVEQVVSSVFAQLFVGDVMEISDERQAEIQQNINEAISQIEKFTTYNGGLSYWPGHEDANAWGTSYGYHFLLEAQKKGYYVPAELMRQINSFQKERARNWRIDRNYRRSDLIQAYRLYTLAVANTPELGAMNRLRAIEKMSPQARWRLGAAYAMAGQSEAAMDLVSDASMPSGSYHELSRSYGSTKRDRAMILETLVIMDLEKVTAHVARVISEDLSSQQWLSTQTTAYSLIALSKYLEKYSSSDEILASFSLNGKPAGNINSRAAIVEIPININQYESNSIEINNEGEGTLFARLILEGTPLIGDSISTSNSLVQKLRFTNLDGENINPSELEQGTDFIAEVTVSNPGMRGDYEEIALTQIFPSGWEIRNTRMEDASFSEPSSTFDYQDIRDDRIYTYFDLRANQSKIFRVQLNAGYAGEFYMPAVTSEAMYDATISARSAGKWIEVVPVE